MERLQQELLTFQSGMNCIEMLQNAMQMPALKPINSSVVPNCTHQSDTLCSSISVTHMNTSVVPCSLYRTVQGNGDQINSNQICSSLPLTGMHNGQNGDSYSCNNSFKESADPITSFLRQSTELVLGDPIGMKSQHAAAETSRNVESVRADEEIFTEHKITKVITSGGTKEASPTPKSAYLCNICHKMFTRKAGRDKHYKIHGKSVPKSIPDGKSHKSTSNNRPRCGECGKDFSRADHLRRHLIIHTGLKPHVCEICNTAYARRDKLSNHMAKKHEGQ